MSHGIREFRDGCKGALVGRTTIETHRALSAFARSRSLPGGSVEIVYGCPH